MYRSLELHGALQLYVSLPIGPIGLPGRIVAPVVQEVYLAVSVDVVVVGDAVIQVEIVLPILRCEAPPIALLVEAVRRSTHLT